MAGNLNYGINFNTSVTGTANVQSELNKLHQSILNSSKTIQTQMKSNFNFQQIFSEALKGVDMTKSMPTIMKQLDSSLEQMYQQAKQKQMNLKSKYGPMLVDVNNVIAEATKAYSKAPNETNSQNLVGAMKMQDALKSQISAEQKSIATTISSINTLRTSLQKVAPTTLIESMNKLTQAQNQATAATTTNVNQTTASNNKVVDSNNKVTQSQGKVTEGHGKVAQSATNTADKVGKVAHNFYSYYNQLNATAMALDNIGNKFTRLGQLGLDFAKKTSTQYQQFAEPLVRSYSTDDTMNGIGSYKALEKDVLKQAQKSHVDPIKLAKGYYSLYSVLGSEKDAMNYLPLVGDMAFGGMMDSEVAAKAIATGKINYNFDAKQSEQFANEIMAGIKVAQDEGGMYTQYFAESLPLMAQSGMSSKDSNVLFATIGKNLKAAKTKTEVDSLVMDITRKSGAINNVYDYLNKNVKGHQELKHIDPRTALNSENIYKTIQDYYTAMNLSDAIPEDAGKDPDKFGELTGKGTKSDGDVIDRSIFGRKQTIMSLVNLMANDGEVMKQAHTEIYGSEGALDKAKKKIGETEWGKMQEQLSDLTVELIKTGKTALPVLTTFTKGLGNLAALFNMIPGPLKSALFYLSAFSMIGGNVTKGVAFYRELLGNFQYLRGASGTAGAAMNGAATGALTLKGGLSRTGTFFKDFGFLATQNMSSVKTYMGAMGKAEIALMGLTSALSVAAAAIGGWFLGEAIDKGINSATRGDWEGGKAGVWNTMLKPFNSLFGTDFGVVEDIGYSDTDKELEKMGYYRDASGFVKKIGTNTRYGFENKENAFGSDLDNMFKGIQNAVYTGSEKGTEKGVKKGYEATFHLSERADVPTFAGVMNKLGSPLQNGPSLRYGTQGVNVGGVQMHFVIQNADNPAQLADDISKKTEDMLLNIGKGINNGSGYSRSYN